MASDYPKSPVSMDVNEARQRLENFGQGVLTVSDYFNSCRLLVERVYGQITYSNESLLLSYFLKGLNEKTRKILELARVNDVYTARKMAIMEEMFSDKDKLENNDDDSRVKKIEMLHYLGWEKMRAYDTHFHKLNDEIKEVRRENAELRDMIRELADKLMNRNIIPQEHFLKEDAPLRSLDEVKEAMISLEETTREFIDSSITSRALQAGIDRINMNFKPLREHSISLERKVEISYEWIRKMYDDLRSVEKTEKARDLKRNQHFDVLHDKEFDMKKPRVTPVESKVLQSLAKVLPAHEIEELKEGNVTMGVDAKYHQYTANIEDIDVWMQQNSKPCTKDCSLCGEFHFSYSCENVRSIKERKQILMAKGGYCTMCWNKHPGKCRKQQECRICMKAEEEGRRVIGGVGHSRMMCPLQEEHWMSKKIADHLFKAKNVLEKE